MRRLSLCTLLIASAGFAAPPALVIPPVVVPQGQYAVCNPSTDAVSIVYIGLDGISPVPYAQLGIKTNAFCLDVYGKPEKNYRFVAVAASATGEQATVAFVVQIGKTPAPPTPDPPGPTPPTPPTPDAAPFPCQGLHVLIVEESGERSKLPQSQLNVLFSAEVRNYLKSKCANAPGGDGKAYRIFDKDVDIAGESLVWKAAMGVKRDSCPWIVISDGKTGYSGPLPANVADTMALLKRFGGN